MIPSLWRLRLTLARLARSRRPILIGPYRSEVGFEVLYWLPLLHWWVQHYQIDPARLIVVSRGGAGAWYPAGRHLELYDLVSLEECRIQAKLDHAETKLQKQTRVTVFDRSIYQAACATLGERPAWLHPRVMYQGLAPWWQERLAVRDLSAVLRYPPIQVPPTVLPWTLPPEFIAVRFYARATFPITAETLSAVQAITERLAKRAPVVVLNAGVHVDDHQDFRIGGANVWQMPPVEARDNLALQAAVLARATAFVGTYGGFAQLALRLGVPSLSLYHQWHSTAPMHKVLSELVALKTGVPFQVLRLDQAGLWRGLLT